MLNLKTVIGTSVYHREMFSIIRLCNEKHHKTNFAMKGQHPKTSPNEWDSNKRVPNINSLLNQAGVIAGLFVTVASDADSNDL